MYRAEKWQNGRLWIKTTPEGAWRLATQNQTIEWLHERLLSCEKRIAELERAAP